MKGFFVVLVAPRRQGNVGAVARAMKNCGLTDLRIVRGAKTGKLAHRMAVHAADVLERARRFRDLSSAVADASRVVAFSGKQHRFAPAEESLPRAAPGLRRAALRGRVALVFGRENHGLRSEELRLCSDLVRIPASVEYPIYNLAQSVLLAAYEIVLAPGRGGRKAKASHALTREEKQGLLARIGSLLEKLAYRKPARNNRSARILARLAGQFDRALIERADLQLWLGLLARLDQRL